MKKVTILILVLVFIGASVLKAQKDKAGVPNLPSFDEKPLHFGFLLGFNTMDFKVLNSGCFK